MKDDLFDHIPHTYMAAVMALAGEVQRRGGKAMLVGGCVRDAIFKHQEHPWTADILKGTQDLDVEIYGIQPDDLLAMLSNLFELDTVGEAFKVYKIKDLPIDVSLPRRDSKVAPGHKGFVVEGDPDMRVGEAAARRDFTINSMAYDPMRQRLYDPYEGCDACMQRYLLHTSPAFSEDPLRVLRGAQFVARFGLMVMPELVAESLKLGREQAWDQLSRERIWGEWIKLLLKGRGIWAGLRFLRDTGWLVATPAIHRLVGCEQNPDWHPEGDAFTHTGQCMDHYALERVGDTAEDLIVGLAVLLHDAGKPDCMERDEDGTIRTLGHNKAGVPWARKFIEEMVGLPQHFLDCVLPLVEHHMAPLALYQSGATDKAVRRLARRVIRIDRLVRVFRADTGGRGMAISQERELISEWLLAWARKLDCEAQQPVQIVMGRHLIEYAGYNQSKRLGRALKALYELQLDGRVTNVGDGVAYAVQWLSAGRIPELTNTGGSNQ